jgi:hypothetical protein
MKAKAIGTPPETAGLTLNQKIKILYDQPKNHKDFSTLTGTEKQRVLDAMDVSTSPDWIAAEIADLLEQRK